MIALAIAVLMPSPAAAPPVLPVLGCGNLVPRDASAASLARRYGAANVRSEELPGAEGETERGTVLFPSDPKRRLEIWWSDVKRQRKPASLVIRDRSRWTVLSPGPAAKPLGLGDGLDAVEQANGRPFSISGFYWDYGGYADFKGGALAAARDGCTMTVRFDPDPNLPDRLSAKVSGDRTIRSTEPALKRAKPRVSKLTLDYP